MSRARFSIGIDLGTTNCALAFAPLGGDARSQVLPIAQWDSPAALVDAPALPSFLYLPHDEIAGQLRGTEAGGSEWVAGRLARASAAESPGRVAHSAKSWLCHHAADRNAPFLPWGSDEIARERKISPVRASALLLAAMRDAWNARFADGGCPFEAQSVTVTVPASFDAAAQRLTLAAALEAGFPQGVRLLEEPQAAFYRWLEEHDPARELDTASNGAGAPHHVLVVDIGGGTSDFSLFAFHPDERGRGSGIERIAVSNHILLGGDNMDLALAHRLEPQLAGEGESLAAGQWAYLVARCRDLKERALADDGGRTGEVFTLSLPGRGSGLIGAARSAHIARAEVEELLLEGFFPPCAADETPLQTRTGLSEWGLPYAADPGVTRHLADFLRDRPAVDAVLFNGGALHPRALRQRLCREIAKWQGSAPPAVLDNPEPEFAVARGAARFGSIVHATDQRIEARSAQALFLEAHRSSTQAGADGRPSLVCILPQHAASEQTFQIADLALELRINRPVRFRAFSSARHASERAGQVIDWNERDFRALPPLETVARLAEPARASGSESVPVKLSVKLNELGLLQIACESIDPAIRQSWPLEFDLRLHDRSEASSNAPAASEAGAQAEPNATASALEAARKRIETQFAAPLNRRDKLTASRTIKSLEVVLGLPRGEWNVSLVRALWPALESSSACRRNSIEHEEAWLILAGFLLRPGFGVTLDELRIERLWSLLRDRGLFFHTKALKLQEHILWRRVSGGLSAERQESLLWPELGTLREQQNPPPELVLLAGSLERLEPPRKIELARRFIALASALAEQNGHCAHFLAALGLLLNRSPLYAGPETVVSPDLVEEAFKAFSKFDWAESKLVELQTAFLRAARVVNNRNLDVAKPLRERIAAKLERASVSPSRTAPLRGYMAMDRAERAGLFGESLPPGLILRERSLADASAG